MNVLITGVAGFVGSHLADYLLGMKGGEVHGVDRWQARLDNIRHLQGRLTYHECDLRDFSGTLRLIQTVKPERVFHLAAQSFVPMSWAAPAETLDCNIQGQVNLFEACRAAGISPRIQIACSSEEYGL
ncbi:MAG: GDP-mannose 4,6-dehydratase, partial [bacterium]